MTFSSPFTPERIAELFGVPEDLISDDGGSAIPHAFANEVARVHLQRAWTYMTDEMLEDLGYPPRAKGLAYWQRRERDAIRARSLAGRLRTVRFRIRARIKDGRYRLGRALLGDMYREDDY